MGAPVYVHATPRKSGSGSERVGRRDDGGGFYTFRFLRLPPIGGSQLKQLGRHQGVNRLYLSIIQSVVFHVQGCGREGDTVTLAFSRMGAAFTVIES